MPWGLALSGGGLLGAAHLGVWQALQAWGLEPDVLAGTSAGGLVVGAVAAGVPLEELVEFGQRVTRDPWSYLRPEVVALAAELLPRDPWPPAASLLDSRPFVHGLLRLCPETARDTDAWSRPTAVTAVDLATLEAVAFVRPPEHGLVAPRGRWRLERGAPLEVALQATMAMPALYTPVRREGAFLVDGGVADTLPVDWAVALGAHRVLAVDVARPTRGVPDRAGLVWALGQSAAYAIQTLSALRRPRATPVLTLAPPTEDVAPFAFGAFDELVARGRAEAERRREEVLAFVRSAAG